MKHLYTLLGLAFFSTTLVNAQKAHGRIKEPVIKTPKSTHRSAQADVLLVHTHRWTAGHPNIPALYNIGPAPVVQNKKQADLQ